MNGIKFNAIHYGVNNAFFSYLTAFFFMTSVLLIQFVNDNTYRIHYRKYFGLRFAKRQNIFYFIFHYTIGKLEIV